jgi:hypothetical protein
VRKAGASMSGIDRVVTAMLGQRGHKLIGYHSA